MGVGTAVYTWFDSYLSGRSQYVRINTTISTPLPLTHGIPQGLILSPLLFTYIKKRSFKHYVPSTFAKDLACLPFNQVLIEENVTDKLDLQQSVYNNSRRPRSYQNVQDKMSLGAIYQQSYTSTNKNRDRQLKRYRKTHSPSDWDLFKQLRREVKHEIKTAESNFYHRKINE